MAAIGEWPERVKKIFNGQENYPTNGQIVTNFYHQGAPYRVTIDDKLPGKTAYNKFYTVYTRKSPNGAWWGPLLEKASAKYYGVFNNMIGGMMTESIYAFTGVPTVSITHVALSEASLWNKISIWEKKQYIMTGAVLGRGDKQGLVNNHAFTTLGVAEYKGIKLVKIRNPWGSE